MTCGDPGIGLLQGEEGEDGLDGVDGEQVGRPSVRRDAPPLPVEVVTFVWKFVRAQGETGHDGSRAARGHPGNPVIILTLAPLCGT